MNKYHNPGGNSVNIVDVEDLMFEMDMTREELVDLVMDPDVKKILTPRFEVRDWAKWRGHVASELVYIGIWNKIYWTNQWLEKCK